MRNLSKMMALTLLAVVTGFTASASAGKCPYHYDIDKKMSKLTKKLDLNADQQAKVRSILQEKQKKLDEMCKQMMTLKDDTHQKMEAVLNADQKAKFEKMMSKHNKKMACCAKSCKMEDKMDGKMGGKMNGKMEKAPR
jgi:K+/H+ antiporter YhaU regulatory subunit KhtT